MMSVVQQTLTAMPVVQAFNREHARARTLQEFRKYVRRAYRTIHHDRHVVPFVHGACHRCRNLTLIWVGAQGVISGRHSLGTILVFLAYLTALYGSDRSHDLHGIEFPICPRASRSSSGHSSRCPTEVQDAPDAQATSRLGSDRYKNVSFGYEPGPPRTEGRISLEARSRRNAGHRWANRSGQVHACEPVGALL